MRLASIVLALAGWTALQTAPPVPAADLWYQRLFLKDGNAAHLDVLERTLYNGYLAGVSISGDRFFYQNPLESTGAGRSAERSVYFDVACCPANLARLMAQLPGLIYATKTSGVISTPAKQEMTPEVFVNLSAGRATCPCRATSTASRAAAEAAPASRSTTTRCH